MSTAPTDAILEITGLTRSFGGLMAVDHVDMEVIRGEIRGLIGPNGSGKSTLLNLVSGVYAVSSGTIRLAGEDITATRASRRTERGVARTFQNIRLFAKMTVRDNVAAAAYCRSRARLPQIMLRTPRMRAEEHEIQRRTQQMLALTGVLHRADDYPDDLPYGERRLVEIARALMTEPSVLLLDEPAAGLNPAEKKQLLEVIRTLNTEHGLTLLLVEHDMGVIMGICDHITVLNFGAKIGEGTAKQIRRNPAVVEAYLGKDDDDADGA